MQNEHTREEIQKALEVILEGGIILLPTDSIWGIACDAACQEAVQRIYQLKKIVDKQGMVTLINGDRMMHQLFKEVPEVAWQLIDYAQKPTTLVLDNPRQVAQEVRGVDGSLAIRIVKDPFCYKLLDRLKKPLVASAAQVMGSPVPTCFDEIDSSIINGVDYVVNLHQEKQGQKLSTMIKLKADAQVKIIRR